MNTSIQTYLANLSKVFVAILCLSVPSLIAQVTNTEPKNYSIKNLHLPDFDDVTVKGMKVSPQPSTYSDSGQGPLSLDAPGTSFSASVPMPSASTTSNKSEFVIAPIPFYSPSIGFGVALGAAYIYNPGFAGTNSAPWITGVGGFYSDNGSWGAGAGHKMSWNDDKWRAFGAIAHANLNYDFFGIGSGAGDNGRSIPLRQRATAGVVEILRGVGNHWYVGGRYVVAQVHTSIDTSDPDVPPAFASIPIGMDTRLSAAGLHVQRDSRDSSFYPTRGALFDVEANFFDPAFGSDFTFQSYGIAYNHYLPIATNQVLALRGMANAASGDAPFFALPSFGAHADLRGYTPGRYRDKMMFAVQAEYRWRFTKRFGLVAFAGVGGVAPELDQFDTLLPSIGTGLRYVLAEKNNVSLRFDAAWGRHDQAFYIGVGEAF